MNSTFFPFSVHNIVMSTSSEEAAKLSDGGLPSNNEDADEEIEVTDNKKKATVVLLPMLENSQLADVELIELKNNKGETELDKDTGAKVFVAYKVAGVELKKLPVVMLRLLCRHYGIKKIRQLKKDDLLKTMAKVKQTHAAYAALEEDDTTKQQKKENDKIRLINIFFSTEYYSDAFHMNDKKNRKELDAGGAGNNRVFMSEISDAFNDVMNDDEFGHVLFEDNEHIATKVSEGLDASNCNPHRWDTLLSLLKEIWKDYDNSIQRFTTSGRHEQDLFGDGFTKKVSTYYYHLHVNEKPESHKCFTATLDEALFMEAGVASSKQRKRKGQTTPGNGSSGGFAKAKEESLKRVAHATFEPIQMDQRRTAMRNEYYKVGMMISNYEDKLEDCTSSRRQKNLKDQLEELYERKATLKEKLETFPSPPLKRVNPAETQT